MIAASLMGLGRAQARQTELPFPAGRLRTTLSMPAFTLNNQDDEPISLSALHGRVVLVTAVYSTCTTTCPMMLTTRPTGNGSNRRSTPRSVDPSTSSIA